MNLQEFINHPLATSIKNLNKLKIEIEGKNEDNRYYQGINYLDKAIKTFMREALKIRLRTPNKTIKEENTIIPKRPKLGLVIPENKDPFSS